MATSKVVEINTKPTDSMDSIDERAYDDMRPYPNEHAARLHDPDKYQGFRRMNDELGDGIHIILGLLDGESEIQSIRFSKSKWSVDEAKKWLADHDYTPIKFDPAIEEKAMDEEVEVRDIDISTVAHRSMALDASPIDEEKRTVRIAVSSEEPVRRSFGMEVLEHSEEAIDLSFLNSGRAPLLLDHDPEKQIGKVESVSLDGETRRLRAVVRFGRNGLAKETFDDVVDGIRANISVGYSIDKLEKGSTKDTYVAKRWKPMECSLVSIPADVTVGVGRAASEPQPIIETDFKREDLLMSEVDIAAVEAQARQAAQKNAAQIVELGERHGKTDMAQKAIREGKSIEEFRGELLEVIGSKRALEEQEIGLTKKEVRNFSLVRAINAMANPTDRKAQEAAKFEFEASRAAADTYGVTAQGLMIPADVLRQWGQRNLNTTDEASLFGEDYRANEFIDVLRNASSVMQAGARMLTGLSGNVTIPKKTAASSAAWISTENADSATSEFTVGEVNLTPKDLGVNMTANRRLMLQSSMDVEMLIRDDLTQAIALAIDKAALEGTGTSGQPTGILNTSGVNTVTAFAAANPTFAEVVGLETAVAVDNALFGNLAYILPAGMYGALKTTEKASATGMFVVEPGNTINGYRAIVSNQATAGNIFFGNFADLLIGMWQNLDIIVDPYSGSKSGAVTITALQTVDVAVRNAVSFVYGNDGV